MPPFRSLISHTSRLLAAVLVATLCAVASEQTTPVRAAGAGIIDYSATISSTKYFTATDNNTFDSLGDFTVEAWIKPDATCVAAGECTIVGKEMSWIVSLVGGKLQFALANSFGGNWTYQNSNFPILANRWQHVAYTISRSTNTMTAYVNGAVASTLVSSASVPSPGFNNANSFFIGTRHNGSGPYSSFTGELDEVRLYSNIRSQVNIRSDMNLYATATGADTTGLALYYDFNEGSGTSLGNTVASPAAGTNLTAPSAPTWNDIQTTVTVDNTTYTAFPRSYLTANDGYTMPTQVKAFDYLVVAGGGGGGSRHGGGGGAGGYLTATNVTATAGAKYQVAVGAGGLGHLNSSPSRSPSNGTNSVLSQNSVALATTIGGGSGAGSGASTGSGGSGGGGNNVGVFGTGTSGQGNNGGAGANDLRCTGPEGWCGGGGGGAGGAGENADNGNNNRAGNGGVGLVSSLITSSVATSLGIGQVVGNSVYFAGGGGGGIDRTGTAGTGGLGGGANGTSGYTTTFFNGSNATGGGGGGGGYSGSNTEGGAGGSGVVLIVYRLPVSVSAINRSMQFAGTAASKVTIPDNNLIDLNMDLTAEAWIYPTVTDCTGNHVFMGKENSYLFAVCNNFISFAFRGISGATWAWYQTTIPVSINTWAHFAFVRSAGRLTIYKNGGTAAGGSEYTTTTGVPTDAFFNSSDVFTVGGRPSCSAECFAGYVDDVRLWNYSRSASAIAQNYNKRIASNVVYFPFDESAGTTVANHASSTGSALNGTSASTTISTSIPPVTNTFSAANVYGFLPGYDYHAGGAVTFSITSNGAKGTATASASTGAFSYVANEGATGNDTFTYGVTGVNGTSTFTYTVSAPSQPMASSKTFKQASDVTATLNTATSLGYNNPSTAFTAGETVRATLSVTNGTVNLTQGSTSVAAGTLGTASFSIDGTQSQINTALNTATVTATSAIPTRVTLDIGMKPADQTISSRTYTYNSNGHFYTRITPSANGYAVAQSNAAGMTLGGRTGYLATIQHSGENTTITSINGSNNSYVGGSDRDLQGTYRWKGNDTNSIFRVSPNAFRNRYNNWASSEPNGENGSEDWVELRPDGLWNDCQDACNRTNAIVEFDPVSSRTVTNLDFARSLAATASSARNLGLGTTFLSTTTWANGETVRATFTASAGTIAYTAGTTTLVSGASASATVSFEGTVAAMNTALNTVTVTPNTTGTSTVTFTYGVKRQTTGSYIYNAVSDHFYFSNATTATYGATATNASNAKWAGTSGYPVTVTTESEYNTVRNINNVTSWSGGSDSVSEGQWEWNSPDAYQIFSDFDLGVGGAISYFDPSGEPNSSGNGMVVNFGTSQSSWDDTPDSNSFAQIYEFAPIDSTLTYNITAGTALTITTPTTGLAATNGTAYSLTIATSGGAGTNVFAVASGALPSGLNLNTSTGVISGTTSGAASSNAITISVIDANSATVTTSSFTLTSTPQPCVTTSTVVGAHTVERITTTGSCLWTVPAGVTSIDAFVVGGGGGGGADGGGGGGGGGYQPIAGYPVTPGESLSAGVGTGGAAGIWGAASISGTSGGTSSLLKGATIIASANGGSGGIGGPNQAVGAGGTSTFGFAGGAGGTASTGGGTSGGVGKNGASNYFLGTVTNYGGGGAGGPYSSSVSSSTAVCNSAGTAGGSGGGGSAGNRSGSAHTAGCDGTANTGGGGGAGVAGGMQTSGGAGGSGIAMIRYTTDPLDAFPASIGTPAYRYVADNFQDADSARKQWVDASGNGRHSVLVSGSPTVTSVTGNGAGSSVRTLSGGVADAVRFSSFSPTTTNRYTLFQVTRYSGNTRKRILDGVNSNWLSGYWSGSLGIAWHGTWLTSDVNNGTNMLNWNLFTDQNTLFRHNGANKVTTSSTQNYDSQLAINLGNFGIGGPGLSYADERSDFNAAEFILYNGELTAAQIRQVENYLARTYNLQGYDFNNVWKGANGPGAPTAAKTGTVSTGSTSQLALSWTAPQDTTGVTGYKVEYKKTSDSTWTTFSASAAGTSVTVTGLDAGTAYDTRVTPVDSGATNRPSALASATTWATSSIALGTMPTNPSVGGTYTLTANVTGPTSTGTVRFMSGGVTLSACGTTSVLSGVASCSWSPTAQGTQNITATYSGDTSYLESTTASATAVTVDYAACATTSATTGRYTYLRVTQTGTCKISTLPSGVESVDVFVVGGGGGGGENVGSGGSGGGAYYAERVAATSSSSLTVTVGAGGRAGTYPTDSTTATTLRDGGNGEASSISWSTNTFTGNGGIGGQTHWADNKCGGVGWTNTSTPGGTGSGSGGTASTGGIGGVDGSAAGVNASPGGAGYSNSITGLATNYGGGGGGGAWGAGVGGNGGAGGGGAGVNSGNGVSGTANSGGGGGGGTAGCTAGGAGGSGIAIVRYANVPTITSQPAAITKSSGQSHTFSVTPSASGAVSGDFTYQWRKDGVNISGATSSTYALTNPVIADAGTYSVVTKSSGANGAVSSVTSSGAVLTMNKGTQSITFGTLADRIYGVSPFGLTASSSASLEVTLTSTTTAVCTLSGSTLTVISNGTCSITASQAGDVNYDAATNVIQSFVVATKALTITGMTATNKEYDRGVAATISLSSASLVGVQSGDTVTIDSSSATGSFANKVVATGKTVTASSVALIGAHASKYNLTQPTALANITAKALTVSGITANNRDYDGTRNATSLLLKGSAALVGVISTDAVTLSTSSAAGVFATKSVGPNKTITISGLTISGDDSANYTLTQPSTTASIGVKTITVTGITATNRVYDSTTAATSLLVTTSAVLAGVESGDTVTLSTTNAAGVFADKNVGTGKTITISGLTISGANAAEYTLTQPTTTASITAKELTVTGITATDRVYDSGVVATTLLVKGSAALVGKQGSDDVVLSTANAAATFANKNIGTNKTISITGITVSGADIANYTLTQPSTTASITAKGLTVSGITATNHVYDSTVSATDLLVKTSAALVGVETNDTVTLTHSAATATFANKNIGTNKPITITGITIGGTDAGNYTLTQPSTTANVTAKELTVSNVTAVSRVYDSTTVAALNTGAASLVGTQGSDNVTISASSAAGAFADKTAALGKAVTITGITIGGTDAGNYTLTQPTTTANITAKNLTVSGITAADRTYAASRTATLSTGLAAFVGVVAGDAITINTSAATGLFDSAAFGTGKTVAVSGVTIDGADAANYTVTQPTVTASIVRKILTVMGITATDRVYDASAVATSLLVKTSAALSGVETGDTVTLNHSSATATFANKNIGTNKQITITGITIGGAEAGNYTLTQPTTSASITAKTLTVSGITATDRVYNASDVATSLLVKTSAALVGVETDDVVTLTHSAATATFANKNIGTNKPITISGITISGADAGNYTLTQPSTTASVTAKELKVTGITASDRVYDSTVSATDLLVKGSATLVGKQGSDTVTLSTANAAATFADKTIGTNKPITITGITIGGTDAGNYTLTQPSTSASITAKELTVSGITASNRVYNSSDSATALLVKTSAALVSVETNDNVTLDHSAATASFADKNIGTNKPITIIGITIGGTDAGNYTLTQPGTSASITAAVLTVSGITATDRVYDSTVSATDLLVKGSAALVGKQGSDVVTLSHSAATATFANKNIGTNKAISISGITIGGTDAGNYTLTQPNTSASITAAVLTVSNVTAVSRIYDRTTVAALNTGAASLVGKQGSDVVTISTSAATGAFADKLVATGKLVTIAGITIGGTDTDNYTLTQPTTTANITAKNLTVSGITAADRTYATTRTATLATGLAEFVGVVSGDQITINTSAASGLFDSSAFGTGKTVTVSGVTIDGADAANYTVTQPTVTASIARKVLTVSGITATDRVYNASAVATSQLVKTSAALVGIETGDTVTLDHSGAAATFVDKTIGTNKTITITGITIGGTDAGNYTLTQPSTTANVTAKELTVSGITATDRIYNAGTSATSLLVKGSAALVGKQGSDIVTLSTTNAIAAFADKNIGTNKTITIGGITIDGTDAGNYTLTQPSTTASITAKELTVTGITATDRVYNATTNATSLLSKGSAALAGVETDDIVTLDHSGATATFATKTVATNKTITIAGITISGTDAANYTLTQPSATASVTRKELTVTGITAGTKIFDGTTSADITTTNAQLVGRITNDDVLLVVSSASGSFTDTTVANGRTVQIAGLTVTGADTGNYLLTQPTTTADLISASAGLTWSTPSSVVYGTNLSATQQNATANVAGEFVYTPASGTRLPVGTHTLSVTFTPTNSAYDPDTTTVSIVVIAKVLTVTGITASDRIYDNTRNATSLLNTNSAALSGVVSGDTVNLNRNNATGQFPNPNIGTNKTVSVTGLTISGDVSNYTLTQPTTTASITAKELTISNVSAISKVYNRSATAGLNTGAALLQGVEGSDSVTLQTSNAVGLFNDFNVGTGKSVSSTGFSISGDVSNYTLTQPSTTANITAKELTVSGITANDRVYNASANATAQLVKTSAALVGVETNDSVTLDHSAAVATFANKNIGNNKTITITGIAIGGANVANYTLTQPTTSASITAKSLSVIGISASNRVYNATTDATSLLNTDSASLVGTQGSDVVNLSVANATATFDTKNVGTGKTISIDALSISGTDSANYALMQPSTSASITAKALTVSGITASNKVYNASTAAAINTNSSSLVGIESGDAVLIDNSGTTAVFSSPNVGNNITVLISGVAATGTDASNYSITQPSRNANITEASASLSWSDPSDLVFGTSLSATQLNATAGVLGVFSYSPTAGTRLDVGTHPLQVTFTPTSSNYAVATQTVSIIVTRKSVTVTANPVSITYGSSLSMSYSVTGLEGADSDSGVTYTYAGTGSTSYAGSTTAPTGAGTYSVTPSQLLLSSGLTSNYTITYVPANLTISKATQASLVASAATYTMTYAPTPDEPTISLAANGGSGNGAITYTITSSGGNCSVSGSVLTGLLAGSCTVIATRAESANYVARESSPITFTVEKALQELSLNAIANKTYGDSDFAAVATATSGLPVSLTAGPSGICEISSGLTIHIVSNGDCTVSATQAGNSNYLSATTSSASASTRTFAIARKTLTISGTTISGRTYDQSLNATSLVSYSASVLNGIVANDNVSIDHNAATATFASKTAASNKPVTVTGVTLTGAQASRYVLTQPTGLTATISQAPLSVSGISVPTRAYNTLTTATLNTANYALSGVTSGDIVTLDSSSYVADFSTAITGTAKVVTVSGLALTGSDATNYTLTQPVLQGDIVKATASIEFAVARTATYNGTPRPLASSSIPSSLTLVSSYSGSGQTTYGPASVAPTNAGAYTVNVNVSDTNYEGTASSSWRINKQTVSVIADQNALQKTFGGSTHSVPFSTSPSGKNLVITYTGTNGTVYSSSYAPTNAGTYQVTASVTESNFDGSLAPVLTISPATQGSISFVSGASATFGTSHQLVAVGGSGSGALTYSRVSGPCSVNATTGALTTTSVGTCVVRADRASSTNYQDASSTNHSIQIAKGSQVVTFTSSIPSSSTVGSAYSPTATSSSGLSPTISLTSGANSVCSLAAGVVTFVSSGVCEISAAQDGDSNWLAATSEVQVVEIGKLSQAISFTQPVQYELGHPGFIPETSSSSGLAVDVSITSGSSVCAQSSSGLITFLTVGTCSLRATQPGDATFSAASSVSRTVTVLPGLPSAPHISSISAGDGAVTVGYTAVTNNGGSPIVSYALTATSNTAPTVTQSNCDASTLRCTLVGLVNSASYSVSVAAVNIRGKGPSSEALEVLVPSPSTIAVQSVTGVRETTNLDVSWEDPNTYGDGAFVQYEVSVRERGGIFGSPVTVQSLRVRAQSMSPSTLTNIVLNPVSGVFQSLTTRARTVRFTNLDPSRLYETKVVTVTSTATVESTNNTTSALVMPLALPSVPRSLQIEATSPTSVQVSWSSPSTDGGTAIQSYAVTSSIGTCVPASPLARTCSINGLSSDASISVSVIAVNAVGSSIAATSSYSMPTVPNAPTIDLVVTTLTAATITWNPPTNSGGRSITSYSVLGVTPNSTFRCTTTSTSCVINGLTSSTTYSFTVRATNNIGTSQASAAVTGTTSSPAAKPVAAPVAAAKPPVAAAPTRSAASDWSTYRNSPSIATAIALQLPPAPARVSIQSLSGGKRTRVTAVRAVRDNEATITYAIISVSSRTNKLLARIKVQVDPSNPTTSVSVPYASNRVKVAVQFANQVGISSGGPAGVNISEGNTFEWTTTSGKATIVGEQIPGNIMFAKGSSTISASMKKSLNKIAITAKARGGLIYVSGFSAPGELASAWLLEPLARARAEAVSKYLAKIGVRQWITFHGTSTSVTTRWGTTTGRQAIITTVSASAV